MSALVDIHKRLGTVYPLNSELLNLGYVANYSSFLYRLEQLHVEVKSSDLTPKWRKTINKYLNLVDGKILPKSCFLTLSLEEQIKYYESCVQMSEGAAVVLGEAFESEYEGFVEEQYEGLNPDDLSYDGFDYHIDYCDSGQALNRTFCFSVQTVRDLLSAMQGVVLCDDESLTSIVIEHLEFELARALYVEKYNPDSVKIAVIYSRQLWSAIYSAIGDQQENERLQTLRDVISFELSPISSSTYIF